MTSQQWQCFDLATHKRLWTYPNPYFQVHGSHRAPTPEPGLTRGAYGPVGICRLPAPIGTLWPINGNLGEWYLLTGDGFYLGHLFQGDPTRFRWPAQAVPGADLTDCPPGSGGEDFGGSVTQGKDGAVYVQAGKNALWNTVLTGLDAVTVIGEGSVEVTEADVPKAGEFRETALQEAIGLQRFTVKKLTPALTGDLGRDFPGCPLAEGRKGGAGVAAVMAYDDDTLYVGWSVKDATPWANSASDFAQMYAQGDTVDLQLGCDPEADRQRGEAVRGDLRLSIGNLQGVPTAVLYRKVAAVSKPRTFTSGVVANYVMAYAAPMPEAKIVVKEEPGKGYVVEAAIPLAALDFAPRPNLPYRGDFGATFGDPAGRRTRLRVYWNNQQTGLVDDVVFELQMVPRNWGVLVFE
jgi:hypothetical protein